MTRLIGYVRVSTAEQGTSGLGLTAQREQIQDEVTRREGELIGIEEDRLTGRHIRRPGLQRTLKARLVQSQFR